MPITRSSINVDFRLHMVNKNTLADNIESNRKTINNVTFLDFTWVVNALLWFI